MGLMRVCGYAKCFSKLDLRSGYHQVRIAKRDEPKTTCVTYWSIALPWKSTKSTHILCFKYNKTINCYNVEQGHIRMNMKKLGLSRIGQHQRMLGELHSFLGLANYYKRFVEGYYLRIMALIKLLKKKHNWCWTSECQEAFEGLKKAMIKDLVLTLSYIRKLFEV
ncbi:uncharacterized protein LOC111284053 [Durio zibethinus]|uniref:Uncharacterized protein LOC111284053 n=1 Tax=Durio zibethinus TaxID=66656 RepID=A0A6P5XK17_DURZI|nr:uncharacterized protein LOC111284053 [Durio zibethinus]